MKDNTLLPPLPNENENQQDQQDMTLFMEERSNEDTINNEEDINIYVDLPPLEYLESNKQERHNPNTTDNKEVPFAIDL